MDNLDVLYRDIMLEYAERASKPLTKTPELAVYNRSCGDAVYLSYQPIRKRLTISVRSEGCIICRASAAMMEEVVNDQLYTIDQLIPAIHTLLRGTVPELLINSPLAALAGVGQFPARVRCAFLPWEGLERIMSEER